MDYKACTRHVCSGPGRAVRGPRKPAAVQSHPSIHQRVNRERLSVSLSACHLFPPAVYCSLLALHCSKLNVVLKNLRNTTRKFMHAYVLAITIYYMQMHDGSNIFMACIYWKLGSLMIGGSARNKAEPEDDLVPVSDPGGRPSAKPKRPARLDHVACIHLNSLF